MTGSNIRLCVAALISLFMLPGCTSKENTMNEERLMDVATRYTAAWCSQNAASVAAFFAENGSLKIDDGEPSAAARRSRLPSKDS